MTPNESKTARSLLSWNQEKLAAHAGISKRTVAAFESGEPTRDQSVELMKKALEKAGITFVDNAVETGVLLAKKRSRTGAELVGRAKSKSHSKRT
jgi:DNA-binding XRE family transcriptional regulator